MVEIAAPKFSWEAVRQKFLGNNGSAFLGGNNGSALGPVYTIPDYFSYRINFYSEVKKQGCLHYAASLYCQLMSFTVAMETSNQYTKMY